MTNELREAIISSSIKKLGKAKAYGLATDIAAACDGRQIDEEALRNIIEEKFPKMLSPEGFSKKCLIPDIKSGLFDKQEKTLDGDEDWNTFPIFRELKEKGYPVKHEDEALMYCAYNYLRKNKLWTFEQAKEWTDKALAYMYARENPSSTMFVQIFKSSKSIVGLNLEWNAIGKAVEEYEKANADLDEMFKDLYAEQEERNR